MGTCNAQMAFKELKEHALESTSAKISSSQLLTYITSATITDGKWRGTTSAFIIHWQEQVRRYGKMVTVEEHFSGAQQKTMLQNAVHIATSN